MWQRRHSTTSNRRLPNGNRESVAPTVVVHHEKKERPPTHAKQRVLHSSTLVDSACMYVFQEHHANRLTNFDEAPLYIIFLRSMLLGP